MAGRGRRGRRGLFQVCKKPWQEALQAGCRRTELLDGVRSTKRMFTRVMFTVFTEVFGEDWQFDY